MKTVRLVGIFLAAGLIATWIGVGRAESAENQAGGKLRVGVFDSRALAIAYAGSEAHNARGNQLVKEHKEAKAAGNQAKVKQLEIEGEVGQELLHEQGFSNASVNNILAEIKDQLPAIAKEADVAMIVSKWEVAFQGPSVELVDVTPLLVKPLQPKAKAQQWIEDIQKKPPMPILELKKLAREKGQKNI